MSVREQRQASIAASVDRIRRIETKRGVTRESLEGIKQELAVMEKGDFFGEIAVLEGLPRSTSAEAIEDVDLIEINSTTFDKMIRANIEIAVRMLRKLSNRLQEANRKIESLRHATPEKAAGAPIEVVDIDRPTEAPPPEPHEAPSAGVDVAPRPLDEVEVPVGAWCGGE